MTFEAWKENSLVGLVAIYFNENADHSAYITNVSVLKSFMGSGIASELLGQCIGYAVSENFMEIKLEVNKESSHAINLYRKYDFVVDSVNGGFVK
ncbi:MAG: GNAT family N-acetyltransferase [Saprospiraceae bacterium]|nr:GNAT family N-acetyltransferase [Saprospiraceae bacterium]